MIKVVIIGDGNVAVHLAKAFVHAKSINFVQRYSRNNNNDSYFNSAIPKTNNITLIAEADIYVIAITDDSIAEFSKQLVVKKGLVVHTSGSIPLPSLQCQDNTGVLYPLQTFSKDQKINFKNIPIAIETEKDQDFKILEKLANILSDHVYSMNYEQRKKLHIAAIFANNFTNHMFKIASDICKENNFSFDILKPIIQETVNKINTLDPLKAQTGPAKRNDLKVIKNQLEQLDNYQKKIYNLVSKSIINTYNS